MIIKFNNSEVAYDVDLAFGATLSGGERVEIIGDCPQSTAGFKTYNADGTVKADYSNFNTVYRVSYNSDGRYQLSNDGTIWHLPLPTITFLALEGGQLSGTTVVEANDWANVTVPTVTVNDGYEIESWTPEIPTSGAITSNQVFTISFKNIKAELENARANKLTELENANTSAIENGVDVTLSDGSVEHFSLSSTDQMDLTNAMIAVSTGATEFPWHSDGNKCKYYSAADIALIGKTATAFVTYSVTLYKDTVDWVKALTTEEEIEAVVYGTIPPVEYQSEVLKRLIAEKEASAETDSDVESEETASEEK